MTFPTWRPILSVRFTWRMLSVILLLIPSAAGGSAAGEQAAFQAPTSGPCRLIPAGTLLRVDTARPLRLSSLRAGDQLTGVLPHPLYQGECQSLPAGTSLRLQVGKVTRVRDTAGGPRTWSSALRNSLFPRRKHLVEFRSSEIVLNGGAIVSIQASLLDVRRARAVAPSVAGGGSRQPPRTGIGPKTPPSSLVIRVESPAVLPLPASGASFLLGETRPDECRVRLRLLQPLSASRNRKGYRFLARILEPWRWGNQWVIPEGSTMEGEIVHCKRPRRLRRAGQMRLAFGKVNLPDGGALELTAAVNTLEALRDSRMTLDAEGTIRAGAATKKRAALDLGLAYVVGKVADDVLEEGVKAGASAVAAGSVATVARYVGIAAGAAFFFAHRGPDVALPEYAELEIVLTRREEDVAPRQTP